LSTVVYKLRVIDPKPADASIRNMKHMEYIGRRPGVVLNKGMSHGLFGVVDGHKAEEIRRIQDLSAYVKNKTDNGTIAYRAIISLDEADALRLGYDDADKWRELVRARMPDMCDKIGIPMQNLEYTAAVHRDKGHPHVHILFWDKEQDIKKQAYVPPVISNSIRIGVIKHVFAEEMAAWQAIKSTARTAATSTAGGFFSNFVGSFTDMTQKDYQNAVERLKRGDDLADDMLIYNRFNTADMNVLASELFKLCDAMPKKGRLQYKLMPPEVKKDIHTFVKMLLDTNADCAREYARFIEANVALSKYYTDNPETHSRAGAEANKDITARLANTVLKAVKQLNNLERDYIRKAQQEAWAARQSEWAAQRDIMRREIIESLVIELFGDLARSSRAAEQRCAHSVRSGELSKQARKELALKLEDSSRMEWAR